MMCIRGFAPPPPAQAFLCAPPPQALGASNPARHCAESCEKLRHRDKEYHDKEYHMCTARQPWRVNHDGLQSRSIIATGGERAAGEASAACRRSALLAARRGVNSDYQPRDALPAGARW